VRGADGKVQGNQARLHHDPVMAAVHGQRGPAQHAEAQDGGAAATVAQSGKRSRIVRQGAALSALRVRCDNSEPTNSLSKSNVSKYAAGQW